MKKNKRLFSIISISLSFLIILSGCSTFVGTVDVSKPTKVPGSEKVVETKYRVELEKMPTQEKPIVRTCCTYQDKLRYNTTVTQKNKYKIHKYLQNSGEWLCLGSGILCGILAASALNKCNEDEEGVGSGSFYAALFLSVGSAGLIIYSLRLFYKDIFLGEHDIDYKYKIKKVSGPFQYEHKTNPLKNATVFVRANNNKMKYFTNPYGNLDIKLLDFKFPISEYKNYAFNFETNGIEFDNSLTLNSKLWIQTAPPYLVINNPTFYDSNGNNRIDANENSIISFKVTNKGKGYAYNLKTKIEEKNNIKGLSFQNCEIGTIAVGESKEVKVPIHSTLNLISGTADFRILVTEENNFDADPFTVSVNTLEFQEPEVIISDYQFFSEFDKMKLGVPITLKTYVQNIGQGIAENISVNFEVLQENIFASGEKKYIIEKLNPGETTEINFEFFANKKFDENNVHIFTDLREKYGMFGSQKKLTVEIDQQIEKSITIKGEEFQEEEITISSMTSDVDKNLPQTTIHNTNAVAVIIGNHEYDFYPNNPVLYASQDRKSMQIYAKKVFGYKKIMGGDNLGFAKFRDIFGTDDNKEGQLFRSLREEEPVLIYVTGHGHSKPQLYKKAKSYIVPKDGNSFDLDATCYPLDDLYNNLSYLIAIKKPDKLILIMDMCFSGYLTAAVSSARWESENPLQDLIDIGKRVGTEVVCIFATQESQTAKWYQAKKHSLLTYFILKAFHNSENEGEYKADINNDKKLTVGELRDFVLDENYGVPYYANQREVVGNSDLGQQPVIIGDDDIILIEYK